MEPPHERCRSCQGAIRWVLTARGGRRMPLNADPDPAGNVALDRGGRAHVLTADGQLPGIVKVELLPERYTSHHATCPLRWEKVESDA